MIYIKLSNLLLKLVLFSFVISFAVAFSSSNAFAASAYIYPSSGKIEQSKFTVSVFVETNQNEPAVASADLVITHTANVKVLSIQDGAFDSYVQKTFEDATREIKISGVNTSPKAGSNKIKLASITFEPKAKTGEVNLIISATSKVTGASNEQMLAETIQSKYTLNLTTVPATTPVVTPTTPTNPTTTPVKPVTTVPTTGVNDTIMYSLLSLAIIFVGFILLKPHFIYKRNK